MKRIKRKVLIKKDIWVQFKELSETAVLRYKTLLFESHENYTALRLDIFNRILVSLHEAIYFFEENLQHLKIDDFLNGDKKNDDIIKYKFDNCLEQYNNLKRMKDYCLKYV